MLPIERLINWLEDNEDLSPSYCPPCYSWILDNYTEGQDIENMDEM